MDIREYRPADEPSVIRLWTECGLTRHWNDPHKDVLRKLSVQPEHFLVGLIDGSVVATLMAGFDGHRGWVNYLAVAEKHRRQGHGRTLMERVEKDLEARGCPKLNLQIRDANAAVMAFYEKLGYARDQTIVLGKRLIPDEPT
jgi:ribosomal protein S18 acetylase RimI-like enzyme